jgi:hypothetical protein
VNEEEVYAEDAHVWGSASLNQILTPEQLAKLQAAPLLSIVTDEVNDLFPEPSVVVIVEYKNERGQIIDVEDLSPDFASETAASVYLDYLVLQILEMKRELHLYFARHAEADPGEADDVLPGHSGLHPLSTDAARLQRSAGSGETLT